MPTTNAITANPAAFSPNALPRIEFAFPGLRTSSRTTTGSMPRVASTEKSATKLIA
ncbi:MAG: hypothetical protein V8T86_09130 [Victivallis sp.]